MLLANAWRDGRVLPLNTRTRNKQAISGCGVIPHNILLLDYSMVLTKVVE